MLRCTIGVMAYNEEQNIRQILHALLNQQLINCHVIEIVVVASGCTDRTVQLAQQIAREYPLIKVEVQAERAGKAAAINRLIELARGDIIVLAGADTLPDPTAIEHLVQPFNDPNVGMTGARVVPLNDPRTFLGFTVQLLWHMHHRMALRWPKLGELVAFRNVVPALPADSATDEVALEALVTAQGYQLAYAPEAVVYNRGPQTLSDFVLQRRRIFAGHLHIAARFNYSAASMSLGHLVLLGLEAVNSYRGLLIWMLGAVLLECWARILGWVDVVLKREHHIWRSVPTTKQVHTQPDVLTLVLVQYRASIIQPNKALRNTRHTPAGQGTLLWWDRQHQQALFLMPSPLITRSSLQEHISQLAPSSNTSAAGDATFSYRVVQFVPAQTRTGWQRNPAFLEARAVGST